MEHKPKDDPSDLFLVSITYIYHFPAIPIYIESIKVWSVNKDSMIII